jgi:hypothetical protein
MKALRTIAALAAVIACSHGQYAIAQTAGWHIQDYEYVTSITIDNTSKQGYLFLGVKGGLNPSHGCSNPPVLAASSEPFNLAKEAATNAAYLSVATASFLSRKRVKLATRECLGGSPKIVGLTLEQD